MNKEKKKPILYGNRSNASPAHDFICTGNEIRYTENGFECIGGVFVEEKEWKEAKGVPDEENKETKA